MPKVSEGVFEDHSRGDTWILDTGLELSWNDIVRTFASRGTIRGKEVTRTPYPLPQYV